ncbi:transcriptional regulator with PAS, ATPase and Fis domain [Clostridiales Family XIII bacterium PM5-7]
MSYLQQMEAEVQHLSQAISDALNVEIEIIDNQWAVVGTTSYSLETYPMEWSSFNAKITRHVFDTKRPLILEDPGVNPLCEGCSEQNHCFYKAGLYYPIMLSSQCHGVVSLVAYNEDQRVIILENSHSFLKFASKMADILASKIQELISREELLRTNEYLETIISSVHEGVIACDADGRITCFNHTAEEKLGILAHRAIGQPITSIIPNSLLLEALETGAPIFDSSVQYQDVHQNPVHLISNITLVKKDDQLLGAVESFNTDESLFRIAHKLLAGDSSSSFASIVGESAAIKEVISCANAVAKSPSTILITGESGTGKELFAKSIHHASLRSDRPFVAINCSAIPDTLLESELFGYEGGAFTGATASGKPGLFEIAQGGTIFLDEIGDMPLALQVKLLRVLQEKTIQRIGASKSVSIDVRVISATHRDLREEIENGRFREDLFYRLNVIPINIPPLRDRLEDIPLLVNFFCNKYAPILNRKITDISADAMATLCSYDWPGNIRELENAIEYAINYSYGSERITLSSLPDWIVENGGKGSTPHHSGEHTEEQVIKAHLQRLGTSLEAKKEIAQIMGISLATLYRKIKKYG